MPLDPSKPIQQQKIPAGSVLLEAGSPAKMLCILHQGKAAAINKFHEGKSRVMYTIGQNATPGFSSLLGGAPYLVAYRTLTDCVVSAFPVKPPYAKLIMGKLNVGLMAARSLAQEVVASYQVIQKLTALQAELEKTQDNLGIVYSKCNPQQYEQPQTGGEVIDPVLARARVIHSVFRDSGSEIPEPLTIPWLNADHRASLNKNYEFLSSFDMEEFQFLRALLALPTNIQGAMYKANLQILEGLSKKLTKILNQNIHEIYQLHELMDESLEALLSGEYSFAEKLWLTADTLDSGFTDIPLSDFSHIVRFFTDKSASLLANYKSLQGIEFTNVSSSLEKLRGFLESNQEVKKIEENEKKTTSVTGDAEKIQKELSGSVAKIMQYLKLPAEDHKNLADLLKKLKAEKNPLDSSGDPRKFRRAIETIYWKVYEAAYNDYAQNKGNVPRYISMLLQFGFLDEELLDPEHLIFLYEFNDNTRTKYPILDTTSWLSEVVENRQPPSVDEMGQTYFENLKMEYKEKGWKRESDVPPDINSPERRLKYELKNFIASNTRLTTGSPTTAFAVLNRHQIILPLEKAVVTKERISETLDKLLSIDYSAFHREIILNDESRGIVKEFVQVQVIPHFIRMPSIGTKMMMWQDLSSRSKSSPGRISFPAFATEDLFKMLLEAVAAFRWELTKSVMGADWNNVAQSSITADYTDYVQFYKKNRDLSKEQKEKLATEFKRFRDDRSRFANDYINWIKYEAEGVLKLNKVCRNIMYKHIPFAKKIRDEISTQPAYAEIHNRFKNIRNRKLKELEVKYRKYQETGLPPELQSTLDYYSV